MTPAGASRDPGHLSYGAEFVHSGGLVTYSPPRMDYISSEADIYAGRILPW